ncbi:unnamed protein product, partial [marine sediment metagenome]
MNPGFFNSIRNTRYDIITTKQEGDTIILKKENYLMLNRFEKKLDYKFKNRMLLKEALTHPSFQKNSLKDKTLNNQRLEFLGDSILDLIVT